MTKSNFPQSAVDNMQPEAVRQIVASLKELHDRGKPETDLEVEERINDYFLFCENSCIRPGIESLSLALHITRTTLFNWGNGVGCSSECQQMIQSAKMFISAFLEQATLSGKLNPASSCFMFKNWFGYRDTLSLEDALPKTETKHVLTSAELPKLGDLSDEHS
jgi:hypothetical protein